MFHVKKDPDAHVEYMHDVTTKENYQNVCICTDMCVCDKFLIKDGYLYQGITSVGKAVVHLSRIWIKCLVDNASFKERSFGSVEKNLFTYCDLS